MAASLITELGKLKDNQSQDSTTNKLIGLFSQIISLVTEDVAVLRRETESQRKEIQSQNVEISNLKQELKKQHHQTDSRFDFMQQRDMKGNIIFSSKKIPNPPRDPNERDNLWPTMNKLIKEKYNVNVELKDLVAFHRLPKGKSEGNKVIVRFKERYSHSLYDQIVNFTNRNDDNKNIQFYGNIQLTKSKAALYWCVRDAKKQKRLSKYYLDTNGRIRILIKPEDEKKEPIMSREDLERLTGYSYKPSETPR